jgi:hypothetical protein
MLLKLIAAVMAIAFLVGACGPDQEFSFAKHCNACDQLRAAADGTPWQPRN